MQITQSSQSSQSNQMQSSNEIILDFYNNDQIIEEMLQNFEIRDYNSDDDSDYENDESNENDENNLEENEEDSDSMPDLIDDDDVSDTDILDSDDEFQNIQVIEELPIPVSPPQLRRERPEDYLTPLTMIEVHTPPAPRQQNRVLRDITNQTNQTDDMSDINITNVSRRLFFN